AATAPAANGFSGADPVATAPAVVGTTTVRTPSTVAGTLAADPGLTYTITAAAPGWSLLLPVATPRMPVPGFTSARAGLRAACALAICAPLSVRACAAVTVGGLPP